MGNLVCERCGGNDFRETHEETLWMLMHCLCCGYEFYHAVWEFSSQKEFLTTIGF
jgi:hypothetical protein